MNIRSRCHRILRKLKAFDCDQGLVSSAHIASDEGFLGSYVNIDKSIAFALTEQALYVLEADHKRYRRIPIAEISDAVRREDVEKHLARQLTLVLQDLSDVELRIDGRGDRFSDVFEVQRFFMRVQDDLDDVSDEAQ